MATESVTYPQFVAKFFINELRGLLKKYDFTIETCPIPPDILRLILDQEWNGEKTRYEIKEEIDFYLWLIAKISSS